MAQAWLNGGKTLLSVPPPAPQKLFWSVTVYDSVARSMVQSDLDKNAVRSLQGKSARLHLTAVMVIHHRTVIAQ